MPPVLALAPLIGAVTAVAGLGLSASQAAEQKKKQKEQENLARNQANQSETRDDTGAELDLGGNDESLERGEGSREAGVNRTGPAKNASNPAAPSKPKGRSTASGIGGL